MLRTLADLVDPPEPPPPFKPLRWRRRRETHRCYMRHVYGRPICR